MYKNFSLFLIFLLLTSFPLFAQQALLDQNVPVNGQFIFFSIQKDSLFVSHTLSLDNDFSIPLNKRTTDWVNNFPSGAKDKQVFINRKLWRSPIKKLASMEFEPGRTNVTFQYKISSYIQDLRLPIILLTSPEYVSFIVDNKTTHIDFLAANKKLPSTEQHSEHDSIIYRSFQISKIPKVTHNITLVFHNLPIKQSINWIISSILLIIIGIFIVIFLFRKQENK